MDHPYQTIPIVYAVANTNIDQKFIQCEPHFNDEEEVFYTYNFILINFSSILILIIFLNF